ncbi:MAG: TetR/AcrR family transcriptional regulator [Solirubrobacterales bacterium]|nr:TetR/AcrR family transcriptional regulator [Solirubrobacterales bacterium]MCB8915032.1 TetR/AcrR family transcriptional regulator [Thermoleophilales bacterium]
MPATRTHLTRDLKRREIVDSAEELFLADGYEKTSMAAVARGAGVASNAIYWYFPGKDDLLAAVLERRLEQAIAALPDPSEASMEEQVLAVLAQLDQVARLTAAVHERSRQSEAVASVHESFHGQIDGLLRRAFRDRGLDEAESAIASEATMALVEGVHLHDQKRDTAARDRLVLWTIGRIVDGSPA